MLEIDRNLAGCIALHPYREEGKAELACLYVSKTQENAGYGRKLMTFVENLARSEGFKEMFALSTQAFVYLQQKGGFHEAGADALPASRGARNTSKSGRHSKVLVKPLVEARRR